MEWIRGKSETTFVTEGIEGVEVLVGMNK